jgi:hypothetical protein
MAAKKTVTATATATATATEVEATKAATRKPGKPVDPATVPIIPVATAQAATAQAATAQAVKAIPATAQAMQNVRLSLGIERADLPMIEYRKKDRNFALQAIYKATPADPKSTPQNKDHRKINKFVIIDTDRDRVILTLTPDPGVGFILSCSDSTDPALVEKIMEPILSMDWLIAQVLAGNFRPHLIILSLTFGLVKFQNGDDYLGKAIPISDSDKQLVLSDYQIARDTIHQAALMADRKPHQLAIANAA